MRTNRDPDVVKIVRAVFDVMLGTARVDTGINRPMQVGRSVVWAASIHVLLEYHRQRMKLWQLLLDRSTGPESV